jgi:hypothetical protein
MARTIAVADVALGNTLVARTQGQDRSLPVLRGRQKERAHRKCQHIGAASCRKREKQLHVSEVPGVTVDRKTYAAQQQRWQMRALPVVAAPEEQHDKQDRQTQESK